MSLLTRKKELFIDIQQYALLDDCDVKKILDEVQDFNEFENEVTIAIETENIEELSSILEKNYHEEEN